MNPLSNPFLFFSIVVSVLAQLIAIYWPPLQSVFSLAPLSLQDWALILPVAACVIVVVEADKVTQENNGPQEG